MNNGFYLDLNNLKPFIQDDEINNLEPFINEAHKMVMEKTGAGNDFLGWVDLPINYDREEFKRVKTASEKIRNNSEALIVIGIGGSYLGAKAAIDMLNHSFYNLLPKGEGTKVFFAGNNISGKYLCELIDIVDKMDISLNVVSKSGTTTEPALAFRVLKEKMEKKYGKEGARERIFATTDKEKGSLKKLSNIEGYETFVIPDDIGGRYSVLTSVGLLPIAVSGVNIDEVMKGAEEAYNNFNNKNLNENLCYQYAASRNVLYNKGKTIEILGNYEPCLQYLGEWWKQLYGESEGKDGKGIFPATVNLSTDLHSMGQYIQDGRRDIFETIINVEEINVDLEINVMEDDLDGLNFLSGKTFDYVNKKALKGTVLAHVDGNVPNIVIGIKELSPFYFGYLVYFFEKACAISGYLLGVNPFDQKGVEDYKKNMFALLGKSGYEELKKKLEERMK